MAASALVVLVPTEFFSYYAYMSTPFASIILGILVGEITPILRYNVKVVWLFAAILLVVSGVGASVTYYRSSTSPTRRINLETAHILIPPGSCVVTDSPILIVLFQTDDLPTSRCSTPIDPAALWMSFHASTENPPRSLIDSWKQTFQEADFVMLLSPNDAVIPWDYPQRDPLVKWFDDHFKLVSDRGNVFVYARQRER